jgi:hypothetical protein
VGRRVRRPKSAFWSGLERLLHETVSYYQKENRELVSLMQSQFNLATNYESSVVLGRFRYLRFSTKGRHHSDPVSIWGTRRDPSVARWGTL